jgi:hypothetical protein
MHAPTAQVATTGAKRGGRRRRRRRARLARVRAARVGGRALAWRGQTHGALRGRDRRRGRGVARCVACHAIGIARLRRTPLY